jgi:hypothetical protein
MLLKLAVLALGCAPLALTQSFSIPARETLSYSIEWRLVTAGRATMDWTAAPQARQGYQLKVHMESVGVVSKLFKVEDDYTSTISQSLCAESTQISSHEGSRLRDTRITFDYGARHASYLERDRVKNTVVSTQEIEIPSCVHDVMGGLYHLRTLNLEPGQSTQAPISDGKKSVMVKVEAQQREDVKTPAGVFKTVRYEVYLFDNVLFRRPARFYVWLSDDRRRLPVQIRARMAITIGTITFQLSKFE